MNSDELTVEQFRALYRGIFPALRYLYRLRWRIEQVGFLPDDPLFHLVARAQDAVQHLAVPSSTTT